MGKETQSSVTKGPAVAGPFSPAPSLDFMALGSLVGAMFLWSGTFIAIKASLEYFHPVVLMFLRMTCSSLCMLPLLRGWALRTRYTRGDWRVILLLIIAEPCLYFIFEGYALRYTTASQAGLVTALLPLLVGVSAFLVLKERLCAKVWTGFVLAVLGVLLLTLAGEETETAPNPVLGNLLELCAMSVACVYTLCVRKLPLYSPFFITAMQSVGGMVFFATLSFFGPFAFPAELPPLQVLFAVLFLSFASIVAYGLYNTGIARIGAGRAAAMTSLIPALTLLMGILFLGESLTPAQCLALVPLCAGVILSQASR
ncbi:DMT family transporter [Desulfovibrio sp. OttesenSCG-928-G15]|nr:DMT family transporter [Desulfovibrio sp. OttesenSCG-928-G15]